MWLRYGPTSDVIGDIQKRILALVVAGAVRPPEVTRYRLSDAVAAHRLSQSRHFRGKLVLLVR